MQEDKTNKYEMMIKHQYKRQNKYISENRYRISVVLPSDYKDRLKAVGVTSINGFVNNLIKEELERREKEMGIEK